MKCCLEFYQGNTTLLRVEGLAFQQPDGSTVVVDDATVELRIYDMAGDLLERPSGDPPATWPIVLAPEGSDGNYFATFLWDYDTVVGQQVRVKVTATSTTGEVNEWVGFTRVREQAVTCAA